MPRYQFWYALFFVVAFVAPFLTRSSAEDIGEEDTYETAVFVPLNGDLALVEVKYHEQERGQYEMLAQVIQKNGWRPTANGDSLDVVSQCRVDVLVGGHYFVTCSLLHYEGKEVWPQELETSESVVIFIRAFSHLRYYRLPPKEKDPIRMMVA